MVDIMANRLHFAPPVLNLKDLSLANLFFPQGKLLLLMRSVTGITRLALVGAVLELRNPEEPLGLSELGNLEVLQLCLGGFEGEGAVQQVLLGELAGLSRLQDLTLGAGVEPEQEVGDADVVMGDVYLWQLLPLCSTLTRLVLDGMLGAGIVLSIRGPGLAVVGRLTCLHQLKLSSMDVLESPCLDGYLLPLPASLRRLELECNEVAPGVCSRLQAAARRQDCAVSVGYWV
jgi:hypothetical protein